jgi:RHS repeat-associated protein
MPQRHTRRPRRWLLLPLALAACLVLPRQGAAQQCTEEPCGPIDTTDPTVTISPTSGSKPAGAMAVQVNFSDNHILDHWSRQIVFNGQDVTSAFTYTQTNNWTSRVNGSVNIGTGTNTLTATICDWTGYNCTLATATYTGPAPAVRVTPDGASVSAAPGTKQTARFTVVNSGATPSTYALSLSCPVAMGCTVPSTSLTVGAADSAFVDVTLTVSGSGTVQLTASAAGVSDAGSVSVGALAAADPGYPLDGPSMERIERRHCVTLSAGSGVANECGELRVVHPLPGARALNKERTPVLVYNHNQAWPFVLAAAHVTPRAGTRPDTVRGYLTVGTLTATARKWPGWSSDTTKRVAVGLGYQTRATGIYDYQLTIVAEFNGSATRDTLHTRTGKLVHVNRNGSAFGPGWWLSGVEQLYPQAGDSLVLWVGGDGSARIYRGTPGSNQWTAAAMDRPDGLQKINGEYVRTLPGGAQVWYNGSGYHVRTVNTLGHVTYFRYNAGGNLSEMVLPTAGGQADSLRYTFQYGGTVAGCATSTTTGLTRVGSPAPGGGYRYTDLCVDGVTRRPSRITDPDGRSVQYTWTSVSAMATRTDRRGGIAFFGYNSAQFTQVKRVAAVGDTLATGFGLGAALGYTTATPLKDFYMVLNTPRTDVGDRTNWWLGRYGMPTQVQNPAGHVTQIQRGDPRWPARVTRVVQPTGFESTATYDDRGRPVTTTAWNPYGDGRSATTTYRWHPTLDLVTQTVSPEGEVATTEYDAQGRRVWDQVGTQASRRVDYTYYPLGSSAPGLVATVTQGGLTESFEYDNRGNLGAVVSPTGIRTETYHDRIGRVTVNRSPVGGGAWKTEAIFYDVADQVDSTVTAAGTQRLIVHNTYDEEGNPKSVSRWSDPDPAGIGHITSQWVYDLAGRKIVEVAPDGMRDSTVYDKNGNAVEAHGRRRDGAGNRYVVRMKYDGMNRLIQRVVPEVAYAPEDVGIALRGFIFPHETQALTGYYPPDPNRRRSPPYPWYPTDTNTWQYVIRADTATFAYGTTGGMTRADNRDARVRRSYYPNGQLRGDTSIVRTIAEISAGGNWTSHVYGTEHTYDRNGRRVELKHPEILAPRPGGVLKDRTRWAYDRQTGALAEVTDPLGNRYAYAYNPLGQVESLTLPGGIVDTYRYDSEGRLVRQLTQNNSLSQHRYPSALLRNDTLTFDVRGKLLSSTNRVASGDTTIATYTPFGHVDEVTTTSRGDTIWGIVPYSRITENSDHDAMGNRTGVSIQSTFQLAKSYQKNQTSQTWAYQNGTGRQFRAGGSFQRDTIMFDEAGNIHFSTTVAYAFNSSAPDLRDQMYYYGADNQLRAAESRVVDVPSGWPNEMSPYSRSFETYRYDALGRRVLVWMRRDCYEPGDGSPNSARSVLCETPYARRTVWDGDHELYEIQAWAGWDGNYLDPAEVDTGYVNLPKGSARSAIDYGEFDINPFYGRVAYVHGALLDQPLAVVRMGYGDMQDTLNYWYPSARKVEPFVIVPLWNHRGQPALGTYGDGGWRLCSGNRCVFNTWPELWAGYARAKIQRNAWHGSLLEDKADVSGLNYRRNRYYDPASGRFTQEDPAGLAGGLNAYGFPEGDPVNYTDPYGLCGVLGAGTSVLEGWAGAALRGRRYTVGAGIRDAASGAVCLRWARRAITVVRAVSRVASANADAADVDAAVAGLEGNGDVEETNKVRNVDRTGEGTKATDAFGEFAEAIGAEVRTSQDGQTDFVNLPGGGTASVRPHSSENTPTVQVTRPGQKTVKVRFDSY